MSVQYLAVSPHYAEERPTAVEVVDLFREAELNGPLDDLRRVQRMVDEAQHVVTARIDGCLVGLVRVLTDFSYNAFIADLAVHPACQRRGIGSTLVTRATGDSPGVKFVGHPGHDSGAFWVRNGFSPAAPRTLACRGLGGPRRPRGAAVVVGHRLEPAGHPP